ncbi:uncharacterized protein TNCV_141771 [Trichonephila clavipes]|nr:uncharacterized protein TNCV_141771 [Trichonephila clavipes]
MSCHPTQYGDYDTRLVIEWVRIPSKEGIDVSSGKEIGLSPEMDSLTQGKEGRQRTSSVLCWDHRPCLEDERISIYEMKILRLIFGGIQENGTWRRSNLKLYHSYKESDAVNFIKVQRIQWAGHIVRIYEDPTTKKVFNAQPIVTWRKGRPKLRWIDGLEKDLLVLKTKNGRTLAGRRLT